MSGKDWCDDCAWEWPVHGGRYYKQLHTHPCDCVCHHPSRLLQPLLTPASPTFDQPGDWAP